MGGLQGRHLEDVAPPATLLAAAVAVRAAMPREETDVRTCWADSELEDKMLLED
jgi:hypothetical protein